MLPGIAKQAGIIISERTKRPFDSPGDFFLRTGIAPRLLAGVMIVL